jgi:Tfp pilus assembly protein PilF
LPDNANAADTLGWVLLKRGVPAAAISYLKEAEVGTEPGSATLGIVRYHLALAYEASGDAPAAVTTLERALQELETQMAEALERGSEQVEPHWAADARSMLDRLRQG